MTISSIDRLAKENKILRARIEQLEKTLELEKHKNKIIDSLNFSHKVFESAPIGIAIYDNKGQCISTNEIFPQIIGATKEQIISQNFRNIESWKEYHLIELAEDVLENGGVKQKEIFILTTFNKQVWLDLSFTSFLDKNDPHLLMMIYNITERKNSENKLRESEERFRNMFINHKASMLLIEPESGNIIDANKAAIDFYGYTYQEITTMNIQVINQLNVYEVQMEMNNAAENKKGYFIFPHKLANGEIRWVEVYSSPVVVNSITLLFSVIHDISERKIAEEKLKNYAREQKEINDSKDRFFSIVSHDLKSPFQGLLGISSILNEEYITLTSEEIKTYHELIFKTSKNLFDLVDNLLNWSRIQLNKIEFNPINFNLGSMVDEISDIFKTMALNKEIQIMNNIADDISVVADKNMLSSILRNLLSNSLKFTPKKGMIVFEAVHQNNKIEISIEDNGVGIKSEDIDKIFGIDNKLSTEGTEGEMGTGLGLIICKELIEKQGGKLRIESEVGKGSKFYFTIPAE